MHKHPHDLHFNLGARDRDLIMTLSVTVEIVQIFMALTEVRDAYLNSTQWHLIVDTFVSKQYCRLFHCPSDSFSHALKKNKRKILQASA